MKAGGAHGVVATPGASAQAGHERARGSPGCGPVARTVAFTGTASTVPSPPQPLRGPLRAEDLPSGARRGYGAATGAEPSSVAEPGARRGPGPCVARRGVRRVLEAARRVRRGCAFCAAPVPLPATTAAGPVRPSRQGRLCRGCSGAPEWPRFTALPVAALRLGLRSLHLRSGSLLLAAHQLRAAYAGGRADGDHRVDAGPGRGEGRVLAAYLAAALRPGAQRAHARRARVLRGTSRWTSDGAVRDDLELDHLAADLLGPRCRRSRARRCGPACRTPQGTAGDLQVPHGPCLHAASAAPAGSCSAYGRSGLRNLGGAWRLGHLRDLWYLLAQVGHGPFLSAGAGRGGPCGHVELVGDLEAAGRFPRAGR